MLYLDGSLAVVKVDGKYGAINLNGEMVINPKYDFMFPFREGLAVIRSDGRYGCINLEGEMVIEPKFCDVKGVGEGLFCVGVEI